MCVLETCYFLQIVLVPDYVVLYIRGSIYNTTVSIRAVIANHNLASYLAGGMPLYMHIMMLMSITLLLCYLRL